MIIIKKFNEKQSTSKISNKRYIYGLIDSNMGRFYKVELIKKACGSWRDNVY